MQRGEATVIVPLNNPVKKSTLKSILNQAGISAEELIVSILQMPRFSKKRYLISYIHLQSKLYKIFEREIISNQPIQ
jgi:arsenate reductase-like glutaredoxin family protein